MDKLRWVVITILLAVPNLGVAASEGKPAGKNGEINVPAERPFDAVNIFGDLGTIFRPPNTEENKVWWERLLRGEVGRDRFLILCALKNGNWNTLGDIRNFLDVHMSGIYSANRLNNMLTLMDGRPAIKHTSRDPKSNWGKTGEGWLEKNREAEYRGVNSKWRIEPSVFPLLYFLLMGCPVEDRCE